ncbi:MAG: hypothetical protein GQF41_3685 [Candidatus Rifleibacterium amylolyticum]|nr:MAG: hypothetical protein GQF41_3685 [Candidatus Rifleibacterium amylolyticum]
MKNRRSGFTLMEIMVVIIVIAVLASVAGPMIGSITDQGRASATKSKISALKSALLTYNSDVGRFPFCGPASKVTCAAAYDGADVDLLSVTIACSVLVNDEIGNTNLGFNITNYNRRWKGPYMDSDPSDYMMDSWGTKITYKAYKNNIYLWSGGPDMGLDVCIENALCTALTGNGEVDDIISSIARFRKKFN